MVESMIERCKKVWNNEYQSFTKAQNKVREDVGGKDTVVIFTIVVV